MIYWNVRLRIGRYTIVEYKVASDSYNEAVEAARQLAADRFEWDEISLISCHLIEDE